MSKPNRGLPLEIVDIAARESTRPQSGPVAVRGPSRERDLRTSIRPTVAEVDLAALRRNFRRVQACVGRDVSVYAVVKADAYGHGAVAVAKALECECSAFAVSLAEEGLELRAAGIEKPILVLGAFYNFKQAEVLEHGLTPVIYDFGDLERFAHAPVRRKARVPRSPWAAAAGGWVDFHLKVDTGMNRLGIAVDSFSAFVDRAAGLPRVRLAGLCTHIASADLADPEPTQAQRGLFQRCLDHLAERGQPVDVVHAANSAATLRFPELRFSAVRPGLALYGAMPSPVVSEAAGPTWEPVLRLSTRIMALHNVEVGATVSYGGQFRAERPSLVATLPVGYADGYPRHVRDAEVLVRGHRARVVGAVCMDMTMIDVTDVPGVVVGDEVTLIGRDGQQAISVDDLASWSGTVNYEIMCGLSKRVPRLYRDGGPPLPLSDIVGAEG